MKVIYNDCYGDFGFSDAFLAEYKVRTGHTITDRRLFVRGNDCIRVDPVAIALLEERGSEWASAEGAHLNLYECSDIFAGYWEIEEYSGNETVHIQLQEALADVLHTYMEQKTPAALLEMEAQYRRLMDAHKSVQNPLIPSDPPTKAVADPVTHTDDCEHSYFSA
jgi:hypothetical protein